MKFKRNPQMKLLSIESALCAILFLLVLVAVWRHGRAHALKTRHGVWHNFTKTAPPKSGSYQIRLVTQRPSQACMGYYNASTETWYLTAGHGFQSEVVLTHTKPLMWALV